MPLWSCLNPVLVIFVLLALFVELSPHHRVRRLHEEARRKIFVIGPRLARKIPESEASTIAMPIGPTAALDSSRGSRPVAAAAILSTSVPMSEQRAPFPQHRHLMWGELTDSANECVHLCTKRYGCALSQWSAKSTKCYLFANLTQPRLASSAAENATGSTGMVGLAPQKHNILTTCRVYSELSALCDCPESARLRLRRALVGKEIIAPKEACEILQGRTVLFTGDSLLRDQWTALAMWLILAEYGEGVVFSSANGLPIDPHTVCMLNAWKFLEYLQIRRWLEQHKLKQGDTFFVCNKTSKLIYASARTFDGLAKIGAGVISKSPNFRKKIDIWILGGGIHQMVEYGEDESRVLAFIKWLNGHGWMCAHSSIGSNSSAGGKLFQRVIFVGTHFRIVSRSPKAYLAYAQGPQGNAKIRRWNQLFAEGINGPCVDFVNPYFVTNGLPDLYLDTEDGMHMGFFVNILKTQLILGKLIHRIEGGSIGA